MSRIHMCASLRSSVAPCRLSDARNRRQDTRRISRCERGTRKTHDYTDTGSSDDLEARPLTGGRIGLEEGQEPEPDHGEYPSGVV